MQVTLLYHTPQPEKSVAAAARLCYSAKAADDLFANLTDDEAKQVLKTILSSGHASALEHAAYTFSVSGVSRALTHQLVRHRIASFNQQSQRYVTLKAQPEVVCPDTIAADAASKALFDDAISAAYDSYGKLIEAGIPAEDARYVLPNATHSNIVITMNIRELLHFFQLRMCRRAQWEIRALAIKMCELAKQTAPYIFLQAGAPCVKGACPEGKMTCGQPYPKASDY